MLLLVFWLVQKSARGKVSWFFFLQAAFKANSVTVVELTLVPRSGGAQLARLSVSVVIVDMNALEGVKEAVDAHNQMTSLPTAAIDKLASDIQTIAPVVAPIVTGVMATTNLNKVLGRLDGFMRMADIITEACATFTIVSVKSEPGQLTLCL
jgi:hypothetical protein